MKLRNMVLGVAAVALTLGLSGYVMADIVGTAHDFSGEGWSDGEICKPCHTPHNADTTVTDAPLWNHTLTTATYTLFDGTASVATADALDGRSILCMSCHDGTVALDSFGGTSGTQIISNNGARLGQDLTDDHPVGATAVYPNVPWMHDPAFNNDYNPATGWNSTANEGFISHGMDLQVMDVDGTPEHVVSCTTCHEPHSRTGFEHMLWVSQSDTVGSGLCLTCHDK